MAKCKKCRAEIPDAWDNCLGCGFEIAEEQRVGQGRERTLQLKILASETTCSRKPGEFCPFVYTQKMGSSWWCCLFKEPLNPPVSTEALVRLRVCKDAEREVAP